MLQASRTEAALDRQLASMPAARAELILLEELVRRQKHNRLPAYNPYPKQRTFHAAGALKRERMLKAGNQQGKTLAAGAEMAMHLTGKYPEWWTGKRFTRPIAAWAAGVTAESTRDNPQRILLGRPKQLGTGWIPAVDIMDTSSARSVADAVDTVMVRHVSGGVSQLAFKTYEKGREKWQGETLDLVWFDEEPPEDIYTEGLTRTNTTGGLVMITFTPLLGMSGVVKRYLQQRSADRLCVNMTIHDALHYTEAQRAQIIASYPAHERDARAMGVPILGSGRIFPLAEEMIAEDAIAIPKHWPRLAGIDFGWDHPTAVIWLAWDRDQDVIHVYDAYRESEEAALVHASVINSRGKPWIPVAWPHDGLQHDKGSGEQLAEIYRGHGVNMLHERAQYPETGDEDERALSRISVEAGIADMLDRMRTGRFKVARHLASWFEEFRLYHRKEGKIVKEGDDLISATRYALMMLRYAVTDQTPSGPDPHRKLRGLIA